MIPRNEYPRPQLVRDNWLCLNGEWQFEIDNSKSGAERGLYEKDRTLEGRITVPFCPESRLSGVGHRDFMACVWYKRTLEIPDEWKGKRILLHFGAVDYHATVYINGKRACEHRGGYTPFCTDITDLLTGEEEQVYGDSGYLGSEKRPEARKKNTAGKKIRYKINRRPSQSKNNSARSQAQIKRREHEKSSVRAKVEHVFAVLKLQLRYRKTRYRGLQKQTAKVNILLALANLILADRPGLTA